MQFGIWGLSLCVRLGGGGGEAGPQVGDGGLYDVEKQYFLQLHDMCTQPYQIHPFT